jgi:hypothetical protein
MDKIKIKCVELEVNGVTLEAGENDSIITIISKKNADPIIGLQLNAISAKNLISSLFQLAETFSYAIEENVNLSTAVDKIMKPKEKFDNYRKKEW